VYTCYIGPDDNWSNLVYPAPTKDYPCFYFTNNRGTLERAEANGWTPVWVDVPIEVEHVRNCWNTKLLRCCPHLYEPLSTFDYLCYLDSKLWITDFSKVLELRHSLTETMPMVLSRHPLPYSSVWGEFDEAMQQTRYNAERDRYSKYIESQLLAGFQDVPLRHCCGFSIRKQCGMMRQIGECWYSHIGRCGIEDQISWQFVVQQFPGAILEIPYKSCWNAI
jgi:hypothetical protein